MKTETLIFELPVRIKYDTPEGRKIAVKLARYTLKTGCDSSQYGNFGGVHARPLKAKLQLKEKRP